MTDETQAQAGGSLDERPDEFTRPKLSQQDLFAKSSALGTEIDWTFDEAAGETPARYVGTAPWGRFLLTRDATALSLQAYFENKAELEHPGEGGSFNALISLSDCDSIAVAKASVVRKLLDAMNQSRRDDPILDEAEPEPDLL